MKSVWNFIKREAVLSISAFFAIVSMLSVPPSAAYLQYIDWRVLALLFCLMAVVMGFRECGVFSCLAQKLLAGQKSLRILSLILVLLPFFVSMFVTNDVALIAFVPFTLMILEYIGKQEAMIWIVVLQTVAANLGSAATPVGNPQNLYLYADYQVSVGEFFAIMAPVILVSFLGVCGCALLTKNGQISINFPEKAKISNQKLLLLFVALFILCLLSVFRVLHYGIVLGVVITALLLFQRELLPKVDYCLLLTFVCFFVFSGNLGQIAPLRSLLEQAMQKNALVTSALASQLISNVPAAVLLSNFTDNWKALLLGVNVGGLGTPIASLASLISLKFYLKSNSADIKHYLAKFTLVNVAGLLLLLGLSRFLLALL